MENRPDRTQKKGGNIWRTMGTWCTNDQSSTVKQVPVRGKSVLDGLEVEVRQVLIKICKTFFLSTLGINGKVVSTAVNKY